VRRRIVRAPDARLIPGMGVDTKVFSPPAAEPDDPTVMLVGRMIRPKGIEDFASAAAIVRQKHQTVRFVLVGPLDPGNPTAYTLEDLERLAQSSGMEYWGPKSDVAAVMKQSTIQVFPTYYPEGVPKTLLEAAASRRAIVASNVPGCRQVLSHGINSLIVPPKAPSELAAAIIRLLDDADLRDSLGAAAREMVLGNHTEQAVVAQHLDIYSELLA
jgi:glycosyltransferase involved in cell wall biosynthesis